MNEANIRKLLLEIIAEMSKQGISLQSGTILNKIETQLRKDPRCPLDISLEQAILTCFYDLFRNGILSWGYNLCSPEAPKCHLTEHGHNVLKHLSRDPSNPAGFISYLQSRAKLTSIAKSYIEEALQTYNSNCDKATAVMVGGAVESIVLDIRDILVQKFDSLSQEKPKHLTDWRLKKILGAIENIIKSKKTIIPLSLFESFESYWPAFIHQIRTARNESGHPTSINPVTRETVHASLLIFPELAHLATEIKEWVQNSFK
ncbi:MAG: hypothetical protein ACFFDN_36095 [Candidatus Hodarchaeota archaeon]